MEVGYGKIHRLDWGGWLSSRYGKAEVVLAWDGVPARAAGVVV